MGKHWPLIGIAVTLSLLAGCSAQPKAQELLSETRLPKYAAMITRLEFPYVLPDGIVAEQLTVYNGEYWEHGIGEQVENVAALTVYNPTEQMLDFGAFAVECDGQQLYFFIHRLPPKSRCLILEYQKKTCDPERITACRELGVRWEHAELSAEQVDYLGVGTELTVINRDARKITQVTVWYKRYDREAECYIGGIAYAEHLYGLQPLEHRTVDPVRYNAASARIVGIELEI